MSGSVGAGPFPSPAWLAAASRAFDAASSLPWLAALLSPDRWLLWLGVLFVLSVYYFPTGVVGKLRNIKK